MARESKKNKAQINKQLFDRANTGDRTKWQSISQQGYDFYLGEQLSESERSVLENSGMPSFIINRITPIVEIMKYFTTANNPRWKAVGATGDYTDIAQIHSDIADYCWGLSNGKSLYSQVISDTLTKGIGYFQIDIDSDADRGQGEVMFKSINPYDVYVDPMSRDILFRDAAFILIRKSMTKTQLMNHLPQYKSKIKNVTTQSAIRSYSGRNYAVGDSIQSEDLSIGLTPEAEDDMIVDFFEVYRKVKYKFYNIFIEVPPNEGQMEEIKKQVNVKIQEMQKELDVAEKEQEMQMQQALAEGAIIEERAALEMEKMKKNNKRQIEEKRRELISIATEGAIKKTNDIVSEKDYNIMIKNKQVASFIVKAIPFNDSRIKVTCSVGDDIFLYEYILPIGLYPIVPIPYMYTGSPFPMSAVTPLVGKQQEINKAHQIMLHNANLASNLRWMYEEGSVPEDEWEQYSSAPGALLKYRQGFTPPTPILPAPINNAFFTVVQEGKQDAEYIAGVPSAMMGFTQQQPETFRGLLANDEFGTRRLKSWMSSIAEPALEHLGEVFKQMAQSVYKIDKVFRIVQPEAGRSADEAEEREQRINIPIYNDYGKVIGKWNDYASARFDIRLIAGATMPINRWALVEEYFRWFQAGLIDDIAMLAETDIRNKKQVAARQSMYAQMRQQLEGMEKEMKNKEGTIQSLERQLVTKGIKEQVTENTLQNKKQADLTKAQQVLYKGKMQNEFDASRNRIKAKEEQIKLQAQKAQNAKK